MIAHIHIFIIVKYIQDPGILLLLFMKKPDTLCPSKFMHADKSKLLLLVIEFLPRNRIYDLHLLLFVRAYISYGRTRSRTLSHKDTLTVAQPNVQFSLLTFFLALILFLSDYSHSIFVSELQFTIFAILSLSRSFFRSLFHFVFNYIWLIITNSKRSIKRNVHSYVFWSAFIVHWAQQILLNWHSTMNFSFFFASVRIKAILFVRSYFNNLMEI